MTELSPEDSLFGTIFFLVMGAGFAAGFERVATRAAVFFEAGFFGFARVTGCKVFFFRPRDGMRGSAAMGCSFLERSVYAKCRPFYKKTECTYNQLFIFSNYEFGEVACPLDPKMPEQGMASTNDAL